jgi:hypothetical protein
MKLRHSSADTCRNDRSRVLRGESTEHVALFDQQRLVCFVAQLQSNVSR